MSHTSLQSSVLLLSILFNITPITAMPSLDPSTPLLRSTLTQRQNAPVVASSDSAVGGQSVNILTIIIPLAVLAVAAVGGVLSWTVWKRRHRNDPPPTTQVAGAGVTTAAQRARRYLSRQESGTTVRSLPMYSREAGDQELVLARQSSHLAEEESRHSQDETNGLVPPSGDEPRPSFESVVSDTSDSAHPLQRASTSASTRSRGPAPTYLEAMSSPLPSERQLEEGQGAVPPPRNPSVRERTQSGVRRLLSRAGLAKREEPMEVLAPMTQLSSQSTSGLGNRNSSHSLLLQPSTSRYSTLTTGSARSSTDMSYTSPWSSSHSLHGIHISSPVPNSAVRASFEAPRGGLTEDQMRFLGSREAVNIAGVPVDASGRRRSRGLSLGQEQSLTTEAPPPSFDEIERPSAAVDSSSAETAPSDPAPSTTTTESTTAPSPSRQQSTSSETTTHTCPPSLRLNNNSLPTPEIEVQVATPSQETFPKAQQ